MLSFYKLMTPYIYPEDAADFSITFRELPLENVIEVMGFLFIVDPVMQNITELKSGAKLELRRLSFSAKEPFSSKIGRMFKWLQEYKSWDELNIEVNKRAFAHREPHLNLLIL